MLNELLALVLGWGMISLLLIIIYEFEADKEYNPYDAKSILLEPYQVVVEKKDIEEINELNYLSFKEKYLGGKRIS